MTMTAACAAVLGAAWLTAWSASAQSAPAASPRPRVAVFFEAGFPAVDIEAIPEAALRQALAGLDVEFLSAGRLAADLVPDRYDVLVMPFGSAHPEEAWPAIIRFLEGGGSLVNVGGRPFAVAVSRRGSAWQVQAESTACYKALGFTHIFQVPASAVASWSVAAAAPAVPASLATGFRADAVFEADIRLTNTKTFADEDGSDGPREGRVQPLVVGKDAAGRPVAAPIIRIDRLAGRFTGGAWVLANLRGSVSPATVGTLVEAASTGAIEITARPTLAGYLPGEVPEVEVTVRRPGARADGPRLVEAILALTGPDGSSVGSKAATLTGTSALSTVRVSYSGLERPLGRGLHEVRVTVSLRPPGAGTTATRLETRTGFWVYDRSMLAGGAPVAASKDGFARSGRPFPVLGTTYMASDVHRRFLLEPNPVVWNRDFAEMKGAGVNLVRTGIWTGWKRYMPEVGRLDESALRALDVFLLTARQHDIPVIFTFFAFLPEAWGGENPFLDPRAVAAQQAFLGAIARRYPSTNDLDLGPDQRAVVQRGCAVVADAAERRRVGERRVGPVAPNAVRRGRRGLPCGGAPRVGRGTRREDRAALARRLHGPQPARNGPPRESCRLQAVLAGHVRRVGSPDDRRAPQQREPRPTHHRGPGRGRAERAAEPAVLRPGPRLHLHAHVVEQRRAGVGRRPLGAARPSDARRGDGHDALRAGRRHAVAHRERGGTPAGAQADDRRRLGKLGLRAVDSGTRTPTWPATTRPASASSGPTGPARPELEPFVRQSRFLAAHADRLRGREVEDVALLVPHSQMFSPRSLAVEATQRAVRVLANHLHVQARAVGEHGLADTLGSPRLIIAPSPRVLTDAAWQILMAAVERGSTLLVTGIIDADERWLMVERTKALGLSTSSRPVAGQESAAIGGTAYLLGYRGDRLERLETAFVTGESPAVVHRVARGKGAVLWMPLPVELSESSDATVALYRAAVVQAGVRPAVVVEPADGSAFVGAITYTDAVLVALAAESGADLDLTVSLPGAATTPIHLPAGRATLLLFDRKSGKVVGRDGDGVVGSK